MKSVDPANDDHYRLAPEGGITGKPTDRRDPYEALDDLMTVVEALCPQWPSRETFRAGGKWRL